MADEEKGVRESRNMGEQKIRINQSKTYKSYKKLNSDRLYMSL
jgi:hypothetical protein